MMSVRWQISLSEFAGRTYLILAALLSVSASSAVAKRLVENPGVVVFRGKPFYSDDLVKCVNFSMVEDRTALNNPSFGYFVFLTTSGELQLPPQAIEARFFNEQFEFPKLMKPVPDLDRLTAVKDSLDRASQFNETVRQVLEPPARRVSDAVKRLQNDEWWEFPSGWISREDRDKRTAQAERSAIDSAAESIKRSLRDTHKIEQIGDAFESAANFEKLPATSSEVVTYRQSLASQLRTEADQQRIKLEKASVESAHSKLKAELQNACNLKNLLATAGQIEALAQVSVSSQQALSARAALAGELSELLRRKELEMRLRETAFDNFSSWRAALDQFGSTLSSTDSGMVAILERSEALYKQAVDVDKKLGEAEQSLREFFARLPAQAILSGEGLPPPPVAHDAILESYAEITRDSREGAPIFVGELDKAAAPLMKNLALYRQLVGVSKRAQRQDLWLSRESLRELLVQMIAVQGAILDEEKSYKHLLEQGRRHEVSRDFAAAAEAYQSAWNIGPSSELAERIQMLKQQDLGL
jgi:hypothetical protein